MKANPHKAMKAVTAEEILKRHADIKGPHEWAYWSMVIEAMKEYAEAYKQAAMEQQPQFSGDDRADMAELIDEQIHYGQSGYEITELLIHKYNITKKE